MNVPEEAFAGHERESRDLLRAAAKAANEFNEFARNHPDLKQHREALTERRERWEREKAIQHLRVTFRDRVAPAFLALCKELIEQQERINIVSQQYPKLTLAGFNVQIDTPGFAKELRLQDFENFVDFLLVYHRLTELEDVRDPQRIAQLLHSAEAQGFSIVTRPYLAWR